VDLESFGFAIYELTQDGEPVNLADGQTATIEYVLPEDQQANFVAGDTIPLWEFDEETAMWMEAGQGTVNPSSDENDDPGVLSWFATIPHFSSWNCDRPITSKHCIRGRVLVGGVPAQFALITAVGLTYNGTSTASTDANGEFCVDVKRGSRVKIEVRISGGAIPDLVMDDIEVPDTIASCNQNPQECLDIGDLDINFDSCVQGTVTDDDGNPAVGTAVFVNPGGTGITDLDGYFCIEAPPDTQVTVFTAGNPSISAVTPPAASCDLEDCVEVSFNIDLPGPGDVIGHLDAVRTTNVFVFQPPAPEPRF